MFNSHEYNIDYVSEAAGPAMKLSAGKLPAPFPKVEGVAPKEEHSSKPINEF